MRDLSLMADISAKEKYQRGIWTLLKNQNWNGNLKEGELIFLDVNGNKKICTQGLILHWCRDERM
jgi:hypothetical protein